MKKADINNQVMSVVNNLARKFKICTELAAEKKNAVEFGGINDLYTLRCFMQRGESGCSGWVITVKANSVEAQQYIGQDPVRKTVFLTADGYPIF